MSDERQREPIDGTDIDRIHLLLTSGRAHEAADSARAALARAPENDRYRELLVRSLVQLGERAHALEQAEFGLEMHPESASMHSAYARALLADHEWARAVRASEAALQVQPEHVGALLLNVNCLLNYADSLAEPAREIKQAVSTAATSADSAIRVAPHLPAAHFSRAKVHLAAREWRDVEHCAMTGLELEPNDPIGHRLVGVARAKLRDRTGAVSHILAADRIDPDTETTAVLLETTVVPTWKWSIVAALWMIPVFSWIDGSFAPWMWASAAFGTAGLGCLLVGTRSRRRSDRQHASLRTAGWPPPTP